MVTAVLTKLLIAWIPVTVMFLLSHLQWSGILCYLRVCWSPVWIAGSLAAERFCYSGDVHSWFLGFFHWWVEIVRSIQVSGDVRTLPWVRLRILIGSGLGLALRDGWVDTSPESWSDLPQIKWFCSLKHLLFALMCDVLFLVRLQGKFRDVNNSWKHELCVGCFERDISWCFE